MLAFLSIPFANILAQDNASILQTRVSLPNKTITLFNALNQLSDSMGYHFSYDSRTIRSQKKVRVQVQNLPLEDALNKLLNDTTLALKVVGKHILILPKTHNSLDANEKTSPTIIKGRVVDAQSHNPIPYAAVASLSHAMGNTTNLDGFFMLSLQEINPNDSIRIHHIGYKPISVPISILLEGTIDIPLAVNYISIQEVVIRSIEPRTIVLEAIRKIPQNFSQTPLLLTTFYREGVSNKKKYQNYSEAIMQVYSTPYKFEPKPDEVRLLKSRSIKDISHSDTLFIKLKAGIHSSLSLDIAKHPLPFLVEETMHQYTYFKTDMVWMDEKAAYQIHFAQNQNITEPLLSGVLYIAAENLAILGADFKINPKYIGKVSGQYLKTRNKKYRIKAKEIKYLVRYQEHKKKLHISHVRGDLEFTYRKRRSMFQNPFNLFFEMGVCQVTDENVMKFNPKELSTTKQIFVDDDHQYDENFWKGFNFIEPEQSITETLQKISIKVEEIVSTQ